MPPPRPLPLHEARRDPAREPGDLLTTPLGTAHVVVRGRGPDVILVHGVTENAHTWDTLQHLLAGDARTHALDLPGHGLSDIPDAPRTSQQMAAWVARYLDAAGIDRAVIVGWSMGGAVSLALAGQHPARVAALVLEGAAAFQFPFPRGLSLLCLGGVAERMHRIGTIEAARRALLADTFARGFRPSDAVVERYWRAWQIHGRAPYIRALLRAFRPSETTPLLARIHAPTWVVHGEHDRLIPVRIGHAIGGAVPRAQVRVLRDTGHAPHTERPEVMAETIRAALRAG